MKPENVSIGRDGYAKLVDLGFARRLPPDGRAHTLLGTPEYLSPEAFLGEGQGTQSDLWSLGATLHMLLLASHPYGGATKDDIYRAALAGPPALPKTGLISVQASSAITSLLSRAEADRPTAVSVWEHPFFRVAAGVFPRDIGPLDHDAMLRKA
eukprot:6935397-Prymnesium_polylepis.1